jgi:crossover junction endodeoxyribonuclease RuvC
VDPGSHKTGWGIIDIVGSRLEHVDNGVLFLDDDKDLVIRLVDLSHRLGDVIRRYTPDEAAVEDVFVQKGARSALILGQARGAALATIGLAGLKVTSIPTSQVKLRVAGRGRAEKAQVAEMVRAILGLPEVPFEDAADALAVAISVAGNVATPVPQEPSSAGASRRKKGGGRDGLLALARAQGKA